MTEGMDKPKAKRTSRPGAASKPAAKAAKAKPTAEANRAAGEEASRRIDDRIQSLGDWRAETLAEIRRLIHEADPEVVEEWKWMGTPVWSHAGNICTGETYKQVVKLTFPRGASLADPHGLFNSSLEGNTRRAIDVREGEALDADEFKALIRAAVAENVKARAPRSKSASKPGAKKSAPIGSQGGEEAAPRLLAGGNPQIAKADGDAPVQAYIAAMPGWKSDLGRRLDALIVRAVPDVRKAVKWNSPFYGVEGRGWFLSFHVLTKYVKVTFFNGMSLQPVPPGGTQRSKEARWIDIYEGDPLDEEQMTAWVRQAAELPGWLP